MTIQLKIQPQFTLKKSFTKVKSIIPQEKDLIKNIFGNDLDIPQIIYNRIQYHLNNDKDVNAVLKIKLNNGAIYWVNNKFEPSINNMFKNNFTVKTNLSNNKKIDQIKNLYKKLIGIEKHINLQQADKFLNGYLEEKNITFNELTTTIF